MDERDISRGIADLRKLVTRSMGRVKRKAPQVDKVNRSKLKITMELVDIKAVPDFFGGGKLGSLNIKLLIVVVDCPSYPRDYLIS